MNRQKPKLNSKKQETTTNFKRLAGHHTAPPTPRRQGCQGENAVVTAHAVITDDDPH
jgi:hypothetical protein